MMLGRIAGLILVGIITSSPATTLGVEDGELANCAIIPGELSRLDCFDALATEAGFAPIAATATETAGTGKWTVRSEINHLDGSETIVVRLQADEEQYRPRGPATFVARCQSHQAQAYIYWGHFLGNTDNQFQDVVVRFGSEPAQTQRWTLSSSGDATYSPSLSTSLLAEMVANPTFVAQTTPADREPVTAFFDTAGMKNALGSLLEGCDLSL
ncbi:MAG: type VI secretion system-associated protein TagO [Candidatus Devosia phytovorans]|uniref:Type VI secretion system-associated protein TagO n=1 Tax=Candidatus Devosia phytovorans TaxID=3121372 RepID=A0AAJ5VT12_9HYPH|nr:type VI secretion system-associated protein TagO [Devosia sp.]WEK03631.1 MAG: type VI secretion system-associated protein TagO [Devosia sp.]